MSKKSKKEYLEKMRIRYAGRSGKKGKTVLIDEFCEVTGHDRKYGIKLLTRNRGVERSGGARGRRKTYGEGWLPGGYEYRLPTEAQWEYACRAGSQTRYSSGSSDEHLEKYAWFSGNSGGATHVVGEKLPNDWGLYDMHGNVAEWVRDSHGNYSGGGELDPLGPEQGLYRILRGGGCDSNSYTNCRSASRSTSSPSFTGAGFGFRIAMVAIP